MKRFRVFAVWVIIFSMLVSSCTMDLSQPTESVSPAQTGVPASGSPHGNSTSQVRSASPTLGAISTTIPITWSDLNLTGSLVYIGPPLAGEASFFLSIRKLNLMTGEITTLFTTSGYDWIFYLSVSPDARQLVMSYMLPSQSSTSVSQALYRLALDETAKPQALFSPQTPEDNYVHPEWSPDGKYIYYSHYNTNNILPGRVDPVHDIFRMSYPDGQTEKIADNAFWPRISADSTRLVYVSINPDTGKNELYAANADGSNPMKIALSGPAVPTIIDAPIFSPDGRYVIFSAPPPSQAYRLNWFETLMGIQVVKAHSVPSDWWWVPVEGGAPTRLTHLQTIRLFASISPDKKYIASLSGDGIFVMDEQGSNLRQLLIDPGVSGTVSWVP